jgi:SNF2 family DNA or RNA helicase
MNVHGFTMKTKPWEHQLRALEYLYPRDAAALYTKPGSGKTKIIIDLIVNKGFKRVLVVAPKKPCDVWPGQIKLHSDIPEKDVFLLSRLSTMEKAELLRDLPPLNDNETQIFICNYDSVWRRPLDRIWFYKKLGIDCVVCDESHRIKSPASKCSRFLSKLGKAVPHRYLMTGTPLAENPMDVYAQYRFLDPSIFGTSYSMFCEEYQNIDARLSSRVGFTVLDKKQPYKNLDRLREKMFSCAFYMESTVKLPKTTRMVVKVPMPKDVESTYKELTKEGAVEIGDGYLTVNNVLSMTIRKQQVTSGYLPLEYDDGTKEVKRISTYRRTALLKFIRGLPDEEPVVVFAKFRKDLYGVRKVAERLGCGYSEVSGSEDTLSEWKSGKTRILGVQYTSGSESIDLTRAHICIFYTLEHSLGKYNQALKRVHRPGQESPCLYYHFVATMNSGKTVDQEILACLKHKENYVDAVMHGKFS